MQGSLLNLKPAMDGETFEELKDGNRLRKQLLTVRDFVIRHGWTSLAEIREATGVNEASASARLRDLRKEKFGSWTVERRRRSAGTFEYSVKP